MAITVNQAAYADRTTTVNPTLSLPNSVSVGDLLLWVVRSAGHDPSAITDNLGTPTVYNTVLSGGTNPHMAAYWGVATVTGTPNATVTEASDSNLWITGMAIRGFTSPTLEAISHVKTGTGVTDLITNSFSTAAAGIVIASASQPAFTDYTAQVTDFTLTTMTGGQSGGKIPTNGASDYGGIEHYITSGVLSSYTAHMTSVSSSAAYTMILLSFVESGGGGGGGTTWGPLIGGKPFSLVQG